MKDNSTPLVSIIIPCYNGEAFVAEAIDSALAQSYPNKEVIVVNDGSSDGSQTIIAGYASRIVAVHKENGGLPAARNSGIAKASGELLAFLDADDYWDETFLSSMVQALVAADATLAYCGWQNIGLPGPRGEPFIPPDYEQMPDKALLLLENTRWPVHAALVKRSVVEASGNFDPRWTSCEDFSLWLRVALDNRIVCVPQVLAFYRHHGEVQMTKNILRVALNHWRVQLDFLKSNPEIAQRLGAEQVRKVVHGELLRRGFIAYWKRDLVTARAIFKTVMKTGYGSLKEWAYMLPSLLPLALHKRMIDLMTKDKSATEQ